MAKHRLPPLPQPVDRKLYKTGQTRGAATSEIFQNRVLRNSTVLIPYRLRDTCLPPESKAFERGSIVLVRPSEYFDDPEGFKESGLELGKDALLFYEARDDWVNRPPTQHGFGVATSRTAPLGGEYVARIAGTTGAGMPVVREGFTTTEGRGAGIRVYEYAHTDTIASVRIQLEALMWACHDAVQVLGAEMGSKQAAQRKAAADQSALENGLADQDQLSERRAINANGQTICPLCLEVMSAELFAVKIQQAAGRETVGTAITETSLFHIDELRVGGDYGHRPYNVGWGHHHCNVVAKDAGIWATLDWMREVVERNAE